MLNSDENILLTVVNEKINLYKEIKAELNKNYALDFNPVALFFPFGENKLSEILTFFLDPNASHHQGEVYLRAFLQNLDSTCKLQLCKNFKSFLQIRTEKPTTTKRRIDIYLTYLATDNQTHCIAIENKIWAQDQFEQLKDYTAFLKSTHDENYNLIYLSPYGHNPSEDSIPKEERIANSKIKILDHSKGTTGIIDQWIMITKPQPIRTFLEQLKNYLEREINNLKFIDMEKSLIDISEEKLEAAFAIANTLPSIRARVAKGFSENLNAKLNELFKNQVDVVNKTSGVKISIEIKLNGLFEGFIIELKDEGDLWYGLFNPELDERKKHDFYMMINDIIPGVVNSWRYWKPFKYPKWYNSVEGIRYMQGSCTIDEVAKQLIELKNIITNEFQRPITALITPQ